MHLFRTPLRFLRYSSCNYSRPFTTLEAAGPINCLLKTRSVIRFKGPETIKFLQGLVTNDVQSLGNPRPAGENSVTPNMPVAVSPTVYAALLNPQGRFLYDLFLYRPTRSDEKVDRSGSGPGPDPGDVEIYADVDATVSDELLETLNKYRLRSKVDIENVAGEFSCWQRFSGNASKKSSDPEESETGTVGWGGTVDRSGVSASQGNDLGWHWNKDPRLPCLGCRGIFPSNTQPPLVEADEETSEENFLIWRLEKGVAEGSIEIPKGSAIPLEYNLAGLNAISFDKGCYIGQELIARTHHRGVIRKRLIPLRFLNNSGEEVQQKVAPGSEVIDASSQKKAGNVTTALGSRGLGLLHMDYAFKGTGNLTIKDQEDVKIETIKPEWWPADWFLSHQEQSAAA
ncbi:hypothetical protein F511_04054 [Dorcoceras hygrometricum]|uniref:CAF17 C-terminal domain-containing protein n=1 Tax=Dorcoceras hygrometricum TaxID=472368 RepID=A0A2Z7CKJ0_9LAMI|nr:hypothetical protein F511_04054 [Dorcoceras hygrometricum]